MQSLHKSLHCPWMKHSPPKPYVCFLWNQRTNCTDIRGEIWLFDGNDEEITMAKLLEWEGWRSSTHLVLHLTGNKPSVLSISTSEILLLSAQYIQHYSLLFLRKEERKGTITERKKKGAHPLSSKTVNIHNFYTGTKSLKLNNAVTKKLWNFGRFSINKAFS